MYSRLCLYPDWIDNDAISVGVLRRLLMWLRNNHNFDVELEGLGGLLWSRQYFNYGIIQVM